MQEPMDGNIVNLGTSMTDAAVEDFWALDSYLHEQLPVEMPPPGGFRIEL